MLLVSVLLLWHKRMMVERKGKCDMQYKHYKRVMQKLTLQSELEKLLRSAENDFEDLTDRQYEVVRYCIIKKIYS